MEKAKELRYKRTLFVGLGGAGAKTLRSLKNKIIRAHGEVPPQVKFLLIDTNSTELANLRDFDSSEKVCIAVREPYMRYKHDENTDSHKYIPPKNAHSLMALERGAGQVRSNGHFAVIENQYSRKLSRVFRACADSLENIDIDSDTLEKDHKIEVRLVFSIAGGTGSGIFLPISVLLRDAIKHCELTAYIYSATHYEKFVENSAKYSVMQNAYAALCELDYMMHIGRDDKRYSPVTFNFGPDPTQQIKQVCRPFEEVYYIDKHTSLPVPESVEFAYNELDRLQDNTADTMFIAATNIITAHTGTVDNVRQKIMEGQFDISDKFAWVSGQGLSEIFFNPANSDHPIVQRECADSIKARLTGDLDKMIIDDIATGFIKRYKWDESAGSRDGDPVLRAIFDDTNERSKEKIKYSVDHNGSDDLSYEDEKITLDKVLREFEESDSEKKVQACVDKFDKEINELIKLLIDYDKYVTEVNGGVNKPYVKGYTGSGNGLSLPSIQRILNAIDKCLDVSIKKLSDECKEQDTSANQHGKIKDENGKLLYADDNLDISVSQHDSSSELRKQKVIAIHYAILKERTQKAISVFQRCSAIIKKKREMLSDWFNVLQTAYDNRPDIKDSNDSNGIKNSDVRRKSNSIEVSSLDISGGFRLKYSFMEDLYKEVKSHKYAADSGLFKDICIHFVTTRGSLHSYLVKGLEQIKEQKKAKEVKLEKTECQKNIERLIDLASPTMQVDRHGYGEQVKIDQFWYIMTDCPEENVIDKPKHDDQNSDLKSVGALLKELIEQNTLDANISLVHVPGWKDKALLYRVKSAVPAFFVDGVCMSGIGSYTLEGCYEELKKTKRTYTPFSHETLRQKLEHKVSALKPMDMVSDNKVLDYWVNFIMLRYVEVREGAYCIDSKTCGERITDNLLCRNDVLVLGNNRAEAYETFQRYCGALLEERKTSYEKVIKEFKCPNYDTLIHVNKVSACDYVDVLLADGNNLCQYSKADMENLERNDPDFMQMDRELKLLETRCVKYKETEEETKRNLKIAKCNSDSWNCDKTSEK